MTCTCACTCTCTCSHAHELCMQMHTYTSSSTTARVRDRTTLHSPQEMNPFTLSLDPSSRAKGTARPSPAASPLPILPLLSSQRPGKADEWQIPPRADFVWGSRLLQAHHGVAPGFARCALDGSPFFAVVDDSGDARQRRRRSGCQRRSPCRLPQYFQCEAARVERDNGAASFWLLLCDDYGVVLTTPRAPSLVVITRRG